MRPDLQTIQEWVTPDSRVLDLGCGDGRLLSYLTETKQIQGYGLEIEPNNIERCIEVGVNVLEYNLDTGLCTFEDNSFDLVIMTQALQAVRHPDQVLKEMLRIGKESIVTFPNFGYWKIRTDLAIRGRMPESKSLPYQWYNTPNIHLCTFKDFEHLCDEQNIQVIHRTVVDAEYRNSKLMRWFPNMFGEIAIYHLARQNASG